MASSSSSRQQNQRFNAFSGIEPDGKRRKVSESSTLFDVFINHRGPDVKQTLASQLYNSLKEIGIRAFLDSEEKELGESFPSTIETAVKSAKVHIAIFSKRYAESPWCLAELVLMLQTKAKIIPVFYQVQPWELRFIEKGEYGKAFSKYEKKKRYLEKLPEWKESLQSMSFVAGEEFNGDCKSIIAGVQKEIVKKTSLHVATYPVGLHDLVEDFQRKCLNELVLDLENQCGLEEGKHMSKVVGIFGMGGVGKTTLAKELFNRKNKEYRKASFLFDVREASVTGRLPSLQTRLLKDLFDNHYLNPTSTDEGMSYLNDHMERVPDLNFIIVVDDIDHVDQLNALMIMEILNRFSKTLIIVTTRDVGVLIRAGINDRYNLEGMHRNNARELFCWHAFNQPHSCNGYEMLVDDFLEVCGGLPLSLQVLGRHVHGKANIFWRSALVQVRKTLPQDVKHRLKISFDSLNGEEKEIFMDIACFFIGKPKSIAERVWEGSGWNAQHSLEMLKDKCLVEETKIWVYEECVSKPGLRMHDHLRDLGREIASELRTPLRLWRPQDLQYLESMGLKNILGKTDLRCFHSMFDESRSCKVTFFLGQPDICVERLSSVLWLQLDGTQCFQGIPPWVSLRYVQCLKIQFAQLKKACKNRIQAPSQLKELQIGFCSKLENLSLQHLSCLEEIAIKSCNDLKSVLGINKLTKLEKLNICKCPKLEELKLGHLSCLESITIVDRKHLKSLSGSPDLGNLSELNADDSMELVTSDYFSTSGELNIRKCPQLKELRLEQLRCLKKISIEKCSQLESLSGINDLGKLVELQISDCGKLDFECLRLSGMRCLEKIILDRKVKMKHFEVDNCQNLKIINYGCAATRSIGYDTELIFEGPICLVRVIINGCGHQFKYLAVINCQNLQTVSGNLEIGELEVRDCPGLVELPKFSSLISRIQCINIESCGKVQDIMLQNMAGIEELHVERYMRLCCCSNAVIRNCIDKLKEVPEESVVIGRAVEGAESNLNEHLFSDAATVTDIVKFDADDFEEWYNYENWKGLQAILCCVVVTDRSTFPADINKDLSSWRTNDFPIRLSHGEWIITMIGLYNMRKISGILKRHGIMKKGFQIGVRKDEKWKATQILHKIVDRLHHL